MSWEEGLNDHDKHTVSRITECCSWSLPGDGNLDDPLQGLWCKGTGKKHFSLRRKSLEGSICWDIEIEVHRDTTGFSIDNKSDDISKSTKLLAFLGFSGCRQS